MPDVSGNGARELQGNNQVGIVIPNGEEAEAITELLREQMGDRLEVTVGGAYTKLVADDSIEIRYQEVAEILGRRFTASEFQIIFASYYGRPSMDDDMIGIYSEMIAVQDKDCSPSSKTD